MKDQREDHLVANLKYILEISSGRQDSGHLEASIKGKRDEIEELCERNASAMLDHYQKYYSLKKKQGELTSKIEQFNLKVQNFRRLENYSTHEIDALAQRINNLDEVLRRAKQYKTFVELAKRAVKSVQEDKLTTSVRFIHKLRGHEVLKLKTESPLHRVFPIFRARIKLHIDQLFASFSAICQKKYSEIGSICFNRVYNKEKERRTIYQTLFSKGRGSMAGSFINMNSSTVQFEDNTNVRSSMALFEGGSGSRVPPSSKKDRKPQNVVVRIRVDYQQLKQIEFIYSELKEDQMFKLELKQYGRAQLKRIEQASQEKKESIKQFLVSMVGFLMMQRQLTIKFKLVDQLSILVDQIISILKSKGRNIRKQSRELSQDVIEMKDSVQIFFSILDALSVTTKDNLRQQLFRQLFKTFCVVRRQEYSRMIHQMLLQDNHVKYVTTSEDEFRMIQKILGLADPPQDFTAYEFGFTRMVPEISNMFSLFFEETFGFLQQGRDEQGELHSQFQKLYLSILDNFAVYLQNIGNPLLITQGSANLYYLSKVFKYYSTKLELDHEIFRLKQYSCEEIEEKLKVELALKTRELIEVKIEQQMHSYSEIRWNPPEVSKSHHDFLQWLMEYVYALCLQLRSYELNFDREIIYAIMGFLASKFWDVLLEVNEFNLQGIYNLNLDLMYIYRVCGTRLQFYENLVNKLKSVGQLVDLLLTGNIFDILDANKKRLQYSQLSTEKVAELLKRYNPGKTSSKLVRQLKKKDVQTLIRRIRQC